MAEIIKAFKQTLPNLRFIGRKFDDFSGWGEMFGDNGFDVIEAILGAEALAAEGMESIPDADGVMWSFERCQCPRFTTPDEKGNVTLDYCSFVK